MKQTMLALCAAVLFFTACNNEKKTDDGKKPETVSEEPKKDGNETTATTPAAPLDSAAQAKAWMDYATPGEMHKWLAKQAGSWEGDLNQWMAPGAPPTQSKGSEVVKLIMNGLYQEANFSSTMMGQPMTGHSLMGFNNMSKKFVSTWIDNFGSGIINMEGTYDDATKILSMKGKQSDPGAGKETDIRQEIKFTDDNNYTMTMYGTGPDGKEMKMMEGVFKRKK